MDISALVGKQVTVVFRKDHQPTGVPIFSMAGTCAAVTQDYFFLNGITKVFAEGGKDVTAELGLGGKSAVLHREAISFLTT